MQPVNGNQLQHQTIHDKQNINGYGGKSPNPVIAFESKDRLILPEDIVNISFDRNSIMDSAVRKKPSVPVTPAEKKALQDSFSVFV